MQLRSLLYQHISWRIFSLALQFILNILVARKFGPEMSGKVFYVFAVNAFIIQICGLSMESGIGYAASGKKTDPGILVRFSGFWTFLATAASYMLMLLWLVVTKEEPVFPLFYSLAFIAGNLLTAYANALFYARLDFVTSNVTAGIINAALIVAALLLAPGEKIIPGVDFITLFFFAYLIQGLALYALLFSGIQRSTAGFNWLEKLSDVIRYSSKAFLANLIFLGVSRIDYLFVRHYRSLEELGVYIQVSKIVQMFLLVPSMISAVLFPVLVSGEKATDNSMLRKISGYLMLVNGICCLVIVLLGGRAFPLVYGDDYAGMYFPFVLMIPGILAMSALYPYTAYFSAHNQIRVNILGSLIAFLFICLTNAIFVPLYGIQAAAAISSGGYLLYYFFVLRMFNKKILTA